MKAGRGHVVPLNDTACEAILALMLWKADRGESTDSASPLFQSREGGCLTPRRILQILVGAARRAGLEPGVSCHSLRKGFASTLLENGASLAVIRELLGHSSISTTSAYLGAGRTALEEGVRMLER